ncbi:hypothetical protein BDV93DRAFT_509240 [Ceratobasidium sp. AG-I]|nr:hypothetical protein BDV93DRAFT_509240 [Ceratobasidium sp. AG-I]
MPTPQQRYRDVHQVELKEEEENNPAVQYYQEEVGNGWAAGVEDASLYTSGKVINLCNVEEQENAKEVPLNVWAGLGKEESERTEASVLATVDGGAMLEPSSSRSALWVLLQLSVGWQMGPVRLQRAPARLGLALVVKGIASSLRSWTCMARLSSSLGKRGLDQQMQNKHLLAHCPPAPEPNIKPKPIPELSVGLSEESERVEEPLVLPNKTQLGGEEAGVGDEGADGDETLQRSQRLRARNAGLGGVTSTYDSYSSSAAHLHVDDPQIIFVV